MYPDNGYIDARRHLPPCVERRRCVPCVPCFSCANGNCCGCRMEVDDWRWHSLRIIGDMMSKCPHDSYCPSLMARNRYLMRRLNKNHFGPPAKDYNKDIKMLSKMYNTLTQIPPRERIAMCAPIEMPYHSKTTYSGKHAVSAAKTQPKASKPCFKTAAAGLREPI